MIRVLFWMSGAVLLVLGVVERPIHAQAPSPPSRVRIIHASPDILSMDVLIDGRRVLANVPFPSISEYLDISPGKHEVAVLPAGQTAATPIRITSRTFEAGKAYSVALIELKNVVATIYTDDLTAPVGNQAHVRIIHLTPDAPGATVESLDGPPLVENLAFTQASPYLRVAAGTYQLRLVTTGDNIVLAQVPATFTARTIYTIVATGRRTNIQVVAHALPSFTLPNTEQPSHREVATPQASATTALPDDGKGRRGEATLPQVGGRTTTTPLLLGGVLSCLVGLALRRQARCE